MVQCCHHHALCQVDVAADAHGADDGVVESYSCVVADADIAYGIVHAGKVFNHASPT